MSAVYSPTGLIPVFHPSGITRPTQFVATNGNNKNYATGTTFYQGTPLTISSAGVVDFAGTGGGRVYGSFQGAEFTDSQGRRVVSSWFVDSLVNGVTNPDVWFWVWVDPLITYEIQVNGSATDIGGEYNFTANSGSVLQGGAGWSTVGLATPVLASGQGSVRVVEIAKQVDNTPGDAYTKVRVVIANPIIGGASPV